MSTTLSLGLLILRLGAGLTLTGHGLQKLFGWFGGAGLARTRENFARQGLQPAWLWVTLAVLGEVGGGLAVALGFLTAVGAAGMAGAMAMATFKSHWRNGFWMQRGGYEYSLLLMLVSIVIGLTGPGNYALDALLGIGQRETVLFIGLALAALIVVAIGIVISRRPQTASQDA
ncbi:MAG: DoxX family protein [Thermogemmatispora sp.]|jgi:putative oxidoreductase|uniref:DoxX family protein n=1 Tax=Thermogemmatispora aurantia TaxID=2045279 RepID=A0A5J4K1I2_9CHLR|nr:MULTISPECIES: DoxX family protein [Thermogemmatispora]MBE3566148.1 DoxX family protein [Thermogemmatispora sp.]GER82888.1 hypothetical protein KTAU_15250 [Thermogemmatispora aurantia]